MSYRPLSYQVEIEALAQSYGLDYFPVQFEQVPPSFMMEVAVYGLPVRMPHWSFGVRYIYQLIQHRMGHSHIFEVVIPGNPGHAYLADTNRETENILVTAHVLGHADFSKNNLLFRRVQEQAGYHIVEQAANHAQRITEAIEKHGMEAVERVLDAAFALEQHIDIHQDLRRARYADLPAAPVSTPTANTLGFRDRFAHLPGSAAAPARAPTHAPIPPSPESDLLWFIAHYAPDLEGWERDILLAVREESFYFQPIFACQIMNEGWASYWHARLLREARFLPSELYVDAIKTHSDVVRPYAGEAQVSLQVNPYHLGFCLWEHIIEHHGMAAARRIMATEDDFGFVRNYLDEELARRLGLFQYTTRRRGREATVSDWDLDALKESLLAPKYHFGAPHVEVREMRRDGTLVLQQDHALDKRGLDVESARKVLEYMHSIWRRPVVLYSINGQGKEARIAVGE